MKHVLVTGPVINGRLKAPVTRSGKSDGVGIGVASYVTVTVGAPLYWLFRVSVSVSRSDSPGKTYELPPFFGTFLLCCFVRIVPTTEPSTMPMTAKTTMTRHMAQ